jgi:CBS domain-containing protein
MKISELSDRISRHDPEVNRHQGMLVLDATGNLAGMITRGDLMRALAKDPGGNSTVLDAASRDLIVTYPNESLHEAASKMLRGNIGRLPVVDRTHPLQVVGYLGRSGVMAARLRRLDEEHVREPGWVGAWKTTK